MTQSIPDRNAAENGNLKPAGDGQAPRPATEPSKGKDSDQNPNTQTDPSTGEPNPKAG